MTAINAIVTREQGFMVTDTAIYAPDGTVRHFGSKVATLPHLNAVIAMRGGYRAISTFESEIGIAFETFDSFIEHGEEFLTDLYDLFFDRFAESGESEFDLVALGYSDKRQRPSLHFLSSRDQGSLTRGAFRFGTSAFIMAPTLSPLQLRSLDLEGGPHSNPVETLFRVIRRQREQQWPIASGSDQQGHIVGGAVVLTTVGKDRIEHRRSEGWKDAVGSPLRPQGERPTLNRKT
jgi:hypothetical protein